jgi:hypothetical protein
MLSFTITLRLLLLVLTNPNLSHGFTPHYFQRNSPRSLEWNVRWAENKKVKNPQNEVEKEPYEELNPVGKFSWYAVEAFGNLFGKQNTKKGGVFESTEFPTVNLTVAPTSLQETLQRIQLDNDRSYFLSGDVDSLIYDERCIFSDPFVSFRGRQRFVDNLQNLGSFITKYSAKLLEYSTSSMEAGGFVVQTKLMVKLELSLPWKPVLAWPWGVRYVIDPDSFLILEHIESWDIEPLEGVKQIFRKATTQIKEKA